MEQKTLLQTVEEKLKELDSNVYYGLASKQNEWNYIVYARNNTKISDNNTSRSQFINIAIVRENYVPEDMEEKLLAKMKEIPGLRKTQEDIQYSYVRKPNTNMVVEIMEVSFYKAVK